MTGILYIDGLTDGKELWNAIDWHQVFKNVSRLQARIVKVVKDGDRKKVRGLQRLLARSRSAGLLAVRRVTSNRGKRTAGVDKVKLNTPAAKWQESERLNRPGYKPKPLKRIYIPKKQGKLRPLGIPTQSDRCEQALEHMCLDPVAECIADKCSNGFRKKRCVQDAIDGCYNALRLKGSPVWIFEGDIKGCFDNIDQKWMIENVPVNNSKKLRSWLKSGYMEQSVFYPTTAGTPQGGIISPTLANIALDGLEKLLKRTFKRPHKVHMVRYADDFIITGATKELLENEVIPLVGDFLKERGLELSKEKSKISHIDDGFDFLGFNIRKYKGKLLTKPSKSAVAGIKEKIRGIIKANKTAKTDDLIKKLNPIIRGWGNFYHHCSSGETFAKVSHAIWEMTWRWAKRRHPKKPLKWVKSKYYQRIGGRDWVFGEKKGKQQLITIATIPIQRHVKIRGEANPYDPEWAEYFKERALKQGKSRTWNSKRDRLWKIQQGRCPICRTDLDNDERWHIHHVIPKGKGGHDRMDNLILTHETCHKQLHCRNSKTWTLPDASRRLTGA